MGNLCSKGGQDNFAGQGRTVGSVPPNGGSAAVPSTAARKVSGPPRTIGGGRAGGGSASGGDAMAADDARRKAAEAAQQRMQAAKPKGKLGAQLEAEQKKSRVDTLKDASKDVRDQREMDAQAENLRHD